MSSAPALGFGRYLGTPLQRLEVAGLVLTESTYPPGAILAPHRHRHAGFRFTLEGGFTDVSEGRARECLPRSVAFQAPEVSHEQRFAGQHTRTFNVDFSESAWSARAPLVSRLDSRMELTSERMSMLSARLYQEFHRGDDVAALAIEGLSLELLAEALRATTPPKSSSAPPTWLARARELLDAVRGPPPTLAQLAREAGVSPTQLGRGFRQFFQCTPADHLRRSRLERASRALRETAHSLSDIALEAGYCDQSHMTREFSRRLRLTPAEYRRQLTGRSFRPTG
ncbi:AraC family transcriptional regulator [Myxococcus stipitatus DSM 14675]|uniref:AraC family transcriptional regulator n=1 Tax=Myxococcus stipitatus (strain DSM 14675 / JCM 12634 / Mx s8) TaxID=1278073 RepID=L7U505_MYXSD|nr:helix-turn-helix transcriptional regulator [Myxococcus stipitatus]AGC42910.1 AraC family transcriptional regulator [Myxococcus stipitatus DSM 14675]